MIEIRTIDREHRADINYGSFRGSPLSWRENDTLSREIPTPACALARNDKVSGRPSQSRRTNLTAPPKEGAKGASRRALNNNYPLLRQPFHSIVPKGRFHCQLSTVRRFLLGRRRFLLLSPFTAFPQYVNE